MNEKQQQLTFDKGITNVPSDAICSDNGLAECVGMIYDDGEHRVIQKPPFLFSTSNTRLLFVHNLPTGEKNYICEITTTVQGVTTYNLVYYHESGGQIGSQQSITNSPSYNTPLEKAQITAIGKTLISGTDVGLQYYLWKSGEYKYLGNKIPEPTFEFAMSKETADGDQASIYTDDDTIEWKTYVYTDKNYYGIFEVNQTGDPDTTTILDRTAFNDLMKGAYAEHKQIIDNRKGFCLPFFVRTAVELYDGSYTYISQPILMLPSLTKNINCVLSDSYNIRFRTELSYLYYKSNYDYSAWRDIVKGVSVFISAPIEVNELLGDVPNVTHTNEADAKLFDRIVCSNFFYNKYEKDSNYTEWNSSVFNSRDEAGFKKDLTSVGTYYKLADLGLFSTTWSSATRGWEPMAKNFDRHTLENITTQELLKNDDFFSRCPLSSSMVYAYNNRLNIANAARGFFDGFVRFMPYSLTSLVAFSYTITVKIVTEYGDKYIQKSGSDLVTHQIIGWWFYYPDPRASDVWIVREDSGGNTETFYSQLEEHPALHGAYCFYGFPTGNDQFPTGTTPVPSIPATIDSTPEVLSSALIQSEVNNPFVFLAEGSHNVGDGKILAMSTQTVALSQGQFGQYPLIVFTDEGIWGMSVSSTGVYSDSHPFSREILVNPDSVIQTDGAVFFASEKGLMMIVGSDVKCVSEHVAGRTNSFVVGGTEQTLSFEKSFLEVLKTAVVAYDYRDSLLWIFEKTKSFCFVYSTKSGTFGKFKFGSEIINNTVNDYPDYLMQGSDSPRNVYSLLKRNDINSDTSHSYSSTIITRPMKLENALALKSILQIRHILQFSPYTVTESHEDPETHETVTTETTQKGTMTLRIFASNNLDNWVELHSLRGIPWKYYRFRFDFANMKATDRFAGTMLITQERRTNKLR